MLQSVSCVWGSHPAPPFFRYLVDGKAHKLRVHYRNTAVGARFQALCDS